MKKIKITFEDKPKQEKRKYSKYPRFDFSTATLNSEEQNEKDNIEYIRKIRARVLKRYLIPTIIASVLCIASIFAFSVYMYNQNALQVNSLNRTISARENDIRQKDQEIKSLNNRLQKSNQNSISSEDRTEEILNLLQDYDNNQNSNNSTANSGDNYSLGYNSNARTCAYPDCDRTAQNGSYYCYSHECSKSGCHEQIANDYSRYCYIHKCRIVDCNNGASNGGVYCSRHECIYPGCHKKKTGISYCSEHEK